MTINSLEDTGIECVELPLMTIPRYCGANTADTDACHKQIACLFLQIQNDENYRPIGCWFCSLNEVKRTYDTNHHKYFAVVFAALLLQPTLDSRLFTVPADHDVLK